MMATNEEPCEGQEVCSNKTADGPDGAKQRKDSLAKHDSLRQVSLPQRSGCRLQRLGGFLFPT